MSAALLGGRRRTNYLGRVGAAALAALVALAALSWTAFELGRPVLLLVGDTTIDLVGGTSRATGGSVAYAAAIASAYGLRACVVTVAGPGADLSVFDDHELHVVKADATLTFEHTYSWWGVRKLRVTADPHVTLSAAHVPPHCLRARTVVLGPLVPHDVDAASFLPTGSLWERLVRGPQQVGLLAQGFQRRLVGVEGTVASVEEPAQELLAALGPEVSLFLSDVETDVWSQSTLMAVAQQTQRLLVTIGSKGALEYNASGTHHIGIFEVDKVVDTNGAGDTFALAYMVALAREHEDPGSHASWAASTTVQQPQACKPHCAGERMSGMVERWSRWDDVRALRRTACFQTRLVLHACHASAEQLEAWMASVPPRVWSWVQARGSLFSR